MKILELSLIGSLVFAGALIIIGMLTNTTSDIIPLLLIVSVIIAILSFILLCTRRSQRDLLLWGIFIVAAATPLKVSLHELMHFLVGSVLWGADNMGMMVSYMSGVTTAGLSEAQVIASTPWSFYAFYLAGPVLTLPIEAAFLFLFRDFRIQLLGAIMLIFNFFALCPVVEGNDLWQAQQVLLDSGLNEILVTILSYIWFLLAIVILVIWALKNVSTRRKR